MSAQRPLSAPLRTPRRNQPDLMRTGAGPAAASMTPPGDPVVAGTGPGGGAPQQPVAAQPRPGRRVLRAAVPAVLIAAAFGFALPHIASYRSVWTSIQAMTWPWALLVGTVAAASMVAYWVTIRAVLPSIRLRQAAAVSLGSNAARGMRFRF